MTPRDIRKLRAALNLSQEKLARMLGTTRQVVTYWESGKHKPSRMADVMLGSLAMQVKANEAKP